MTNMFDNKTVKYIQIGKNIMKFDEIELYDNYGNLFKRIPYTVQKEGYDWGLVKYHGALIYVPKNLIITEKDQQKETKKQKRMLANYEDLI